MRVNVTDFSEIEAEFTERAHQMVWCSVATVGTDGRPHSRVLHPFWAKGFGWITTYRNSPKSKQLELNPYMSLAYVANPFKPVYAECTVEWGDETEKRYVWDFFKSTPEPLGFDPGMMWKGVDDPQYGILKLTPYRIELHDIPSPPGVIKVWRRPEST